MAFAQSLGGVSHLAASPSQCLTTEPKLPTEPKKEQKPPVSCEKIPSHFQRPDTTRKTHSVVVGGALVSRKRNPLKQVEITLGLLQG